MEKKIIVKNNNRETEAKRYAKRPRKLSVCLAFLFGVGLALLPVKVMAASLYFSPSSGSYDVGSIITVGVYVSGAEQAMNAASGVISFSNDKLEVASLSKNGSIFSLWIQEPSFSNSAGVINFEGIALNPGFPKMGGELLMVNFRIKAPGTVFLNFSSGMVLANDGRGSNILTGLDNAQFNLVSAEQPLAPEIAVSSKLLTDASSAPKTMLTAQSEPVKWYPLNVAEFTWKLLRNATGGVSLSVGKKIWMPFLRLIAFQQSAQKNWITLVMGSDIL